MADTLSDDADDPVRVQHGRHTLMARHVANRAQLEGAWSREMGAARSARSTGDTTSEWRYLERAHILSQPLGHLHVRTHGAMLRAATRRREWHEVLGQLFRIAVAAPG